MPATRQTRASQRAAEGSSSTSAPSPPAPLATRNGSTRTPKDAKSNITKPTRRTRASRENEGQGESSDKEDNTVSDDDANQDEDDQEDVHAPSMTSLPSVEQKSGTSLTKDMLDEHNAQEESNKSWTGPKSENDHMELDHVKTETSDAVDLPHQDPLYKLAAELDSGSEGDDESDIDIDDDNYDEVDNISNSSEASDQIEAAFEQEINDHGIDWDDANTYAYDGSWQNHPYGLAIEMGLDDSPLRDAFLTWEATESARERQTRERQATSTQSEHKPTAAKTNTDDGFSSDSDSTAQSGVSADGNRASKSDLNRADSFENDEDDDGESTDEDIPQVASPSVIPSSNPRRPPRKIQIVDPSASTPSRSPSFEQEHAITPFVRSKKRKYPVLRKMVAPTNKAVAYTLTTPKGRIMQFRLPKGHTLKWVSAENSRTTSPTMSSPTSVDMDTPEASQSRAVIDNVLQGRLFQETFCSPSVTPHTRRSNRSSGFANIPFLNNVFRPLLSGQPFQQSQGSFGLFDDSQSDGVNDDDMTFALVDFGEEDDDTESGALEHTSTPLSQIDTPGSSLMAAPDLGADFEAGPLGGFLAHRGDVVENAMDDDDEDSPQDLDDVYVADLTSPRKRRVSNLPRERTSLSPILKRQKLGTAQEVSI